MSRLRLAPLLLLPCIAPTRLPPRSAGAPGPVEAVLGELHNLAPRADRVADVDHLVLKRDAAEFQLEKGTLQLLTPVAGRTVGALFVGTGTVTFRPPLEVERAELVRVLHDSIVATPISSAVFVFTDSTEAELTHLASFHGLTRPGTPVDAIKAALDFLIDDRAGWVEPALMTDLLNGNAAGFFAGFIKRQRGEDLMFEVNPQNSEEVSLFRRGKLPGQRVQVLSQFQRAEHLRDSVASADEHPDPLQLEAYKIEATIKDNLAFAASALVRLRARGDNNRWTRLRLYDPLEVDSVLSGAGTSLLFYRPRNSGELWVRFDSTVAAGREGAFRVVYHGHLLEWGSLTGKVMDHWVFIKSTEEWFPRYGWLQPAAMELTFHTPADDHFVTIGRRIEQHVEGKVETSRWVTDTPTAEASFNLGIFEEFEITDPRIPPVTVQINSDAHAALTQIYGFAQRNPREQVGGDVANSLAFFTKVFGPPLFPHYVATEIPYGHGQAFPGLIHLSWWTFQAVSDKGDNEVFRAHEMAHQWWGIGVAPADYRDAWLAEGFADFAGLWYMQFILRENENYFKQLDDWATLIRAARGDAAPPIGLGYRVGQVDPAHYEAIVYRKGAWVLHMLRNLMLDFRSMNEDRFEAMLQDFYTTYRGRRASTQDFQRVVEDHIGRSMDWFFNQWVYGTTIPTYNFSWNTKPAPNGGVILGFRVRPEHVSQDFIMPVPLMIEFPDSSRVVVRINTRGTQVEGEIPLNAKPVRVEFNPLQSVLAEVKQEGWRQAAKVP